MQEFEFELTDVFYPLLTKEETKELREKMVKGIEITAYYRGNVTKTTWYSLTKRVERFLYMQPWERGDEPYSHVSWDDSYKDLKVKQTKDGKVRFSASKTFKIDKIDKDAGQKIKGTLDLRGFVIRMPVDFLYERVTDEDYGGIAHVIYIGITEGKDEGTSNYAYSSFKPINNGENKEINMLFKDNIGATFQAVSKLSSVKGGKALPTPIITEDIYNSAPYYLASKYYEPRLTFSGKLYNIFHDDKHYDDSFIVQNLKNLPFKIHRGEYSAHNRVESFRAHALSREKATTLADLTIWGMKTHSVTVLDAYANYEEREYRNRRTYDPNAACVFDYSVGFYEGEEERYVTLLNTEGKYERIYIKDRDISSILEYERRLEKTLKDKKKLANCKELLSHAKYLLSLDKQSVIKEFEYYRATLKSAYEESLNTDRYMLIKENEQESYGAILYKDKTTFEGSFKNGLREMSGVTIFPNGNIFKASYENDVMKDSRHPVLIYDKAAIRCHLGHFDEKLRGSGKLRMEFGYRGVDESYNHNIKYNMFDGNFTDGVAGGGGWFRLEHKRDGAKVNKESIVEGGVKDGYFDGKASLKYDFDDGKDDYGHKNYEIEFEKGKIVKTGGYDKALIKELQEYLDILQPFICDASQTHLHDGNS